MKWFWKEAFWWQNERLSFVCTYVWKCVYMDKHMLRASEVPGTPLSWVRPSSEKHPDGGERGGGVRTQCTWLSCIFTVTISHVQHASSSWLLARSIIILLQNLSLRQLILGNPSTAGWGQILSTIACPRTSMHCLASAQKQFLIKGMVKRPRSSVLKSPRSIVLILESPSSLATTNPKFSIQGLRPFFQIQTWQYSTHNQIEVTGIVGPEGQSTF